MFLSTLCVFFFEVNLIEQSLRFNDDTIRKDFEEQIDWNKTKINGRLQSQFGRERTAPFFEKLENSWKNLIEMRKNKTINRFDANLFFQYFDINGHGKVLSIFTELARYGQINFAMILFKFSLIFSFFCEYIFPL